MVLCVALVRTDDSREGAPLGAAVAPASCVKGANSMTSTQQLKGRAGKLSHKTIAILATDGFEQSELEEPREMFDREGAKTVLVSLKGGKVQGFKHHDKADQFDVDRTLDQVDAKDFDALLLPGGALNPDALRANPAAVAFVKAFADSKKPIAAICHGPWTLVEADVVRGRTVTSWPSIKTDLKNAGATWVDREVVVDGTLVTSRKPDDIPAFGKRAIDVISAS
jgi:protease I